MCRHAGHFLHSVHNQSFLHITNVMCTCLRPHIAYDLLRYVVLCVLSISVFFVYVTCLYCYVLLEDTGKQSVITICLH